MAEGWLRHFAKGAFEVFSAGTHPKGVHPMAIEVMREVGIDISGQTSDSVAQFAGESFDVVVTVCDSARENCPVFPGTGRTLHRSFRDPDLPNASEDELRAVFREIRDEIGNWARDFVTAEIGTQAPPPASAVPPGT